MTSWSIFSSVPEPSEFPLTNLQAGKSYAVTISVDSLDRMTGDSEIETSISDARGVVAAKTLNPGDLDFYVTLRPRATGSGMVRLTRRGAARDAPVSVDCRPMRMAKGDAVIAAQPNSTWQQAQEFELGQTVFSTGDERAFIPAPSEDTYQALVKGFQWFRFTYKGTGSKLVYFTLDILDREVPVDIEIFQLGRNPTTGEEDVAASRDGWNAAFPSPPRELHPETVDVFLSEADQFWELPDEKCCRFFGALLPAAISRWCARPRWLRWAALPIPGRSTLRSRRSRRARKPSS